MGENTAGCALSSFVASFNTGVNASSSFYTATVQLAASGGTHAPEMSSFPCDIFLRCCAMVLWYVAGLFDGIKTLDSITTRCVQECFYQIRECKWRCKDNGFLTGGGGGRRKITLWWWSVIISATMIVTISSSSIDYGTRRFSMRLGVKTKTKNPNKIREREGERERESKVPLRFVSRR